MIRRPRRTVAASLVALSVLATCTVLTVSCVQILLGQAPLLPLATLADLGAAVTGQAPAVVATCVAAALIGLVLFATAVRPGDPTVLPLQDRGNGIETGLARRGLDRALAAAAGSVDGITRTTARTRGRRTTLSAHAAFGEPAEQRTAVRAAATARLTELRTARPQRLRIRITTDREN